MILDSIILDNIRSYSHEEIKFPKGISLFVGDIGSGKSTILMSIEFALFGSGSQKMESLVAKKADSGYVELRFSVDKIKYEIKRTLIKKESKITQKANESWLKVEGEKETLSATEMKQRILQILKFNEPEEANAGSRIFRYAVFTPQEAMKDVLSDSKMRLETIRRAFGIEEYNIAASNAQVLLQEITFILGTFEGRFEDIPKLEKENEESKDNIAALNVSIINASKKLEMDKQSESEATTKMDELQEKDRQRVETEYKIDAVKRKISDARKQEKRIEEDSAECNVELKRNETLLEKLEEIEKPNITKTVQELDFDLEKFQNADAEWNRLGGEKSNVIREIAELSESLGEIAPNSKYLANNLEELQLDVNTLNERREELKDKRENLMRQQSEERAQKKIVEGEIINLQQLGKECPTCGQRFEGEPRQELMDKKQQQTSQLETKIKVTTDSLERADDELKETISKIDECNTKIDKIKKNIVNVERLESKKAESSEIENKIAKLGGWYDGKRYEGDRCKEAIRTISQTKDAVIQYENYTKQRRQAEEGRKAITDRIQKNQELIEEQRGLIVNDEAELNRLQVSYKFEGLEEQITEKKAQIDTIREDITKAKILLARDEERKTSENQRISSNDERIAKSKKWKERHTKVSECAEWIRKFFIPALYNIEKQVLLSILQNFNETYSRWYSILVEDPTKESSINEEFTPIVKQDGYDQDVKYLSGGEKTSVALAYRLTLNSLVRKETESMKSNLLILDEPTDGFSKSQLGKMRELLDELRSEQIILVSHEKELEAHVDNMFEISKYDGTSKVSENLAKMTP